MRTMTRLAGCLAALCALAALAAPAQAQNYPTRPITMIVPFAAGGPTDVIARIVGEHMSKTLGQQIVIENVVGAGGTTGATRASARQPDGYTIMMGHMGTHAAAVRALSEARLPSDQGFRADRPCRRHADPDRGEEGLPGQGSEGIRRLRESERGQAECRACRRRLGVVHDLPAAQLAARREADRDPVPAAPARR